MTEKAIFNKTEYNEKKTINIHDYRGETPIFSTIREGKYDLTKSLIENGAKINIFNNEGNSPLSLASCQKYDILKLIISNGADIILVNHKKYEILKLIISIGANTTKIYKNSSPLYLALTTDIDDTKIKKVKLLLYFGVPITDLELEYIEKFKFYEENLLSFPDEDTLNKTICAQIIWKVKEDPKKLEEIIKYEKDEFEEIK